MVRVFNTVKAKKFIRKISLFKDDLGEKDNTVPEQPSKANTILFPKYLICEYEKFMHTDSIFHIQIGNYAQFGDVMLRNYLKTRKIPVDLTNKNGKTNLHIAATSLEENHETSIHALIKNGANVNAKDDSGNTPLHFAASVRSFMDKYLLSLNMLIENGADFNEKNNAGDTPLHVATALENFKAVSTLINSGASKLIKNKEGLTPYDLAASKNNYKIQHILAEYDEHNQTDVNPLFQSTDVKLLGDPVKNTLSYFESHLSQLGDQ